MRLSFIGIILLVLSACGSTDNSTSVGSMSNSVDSTSMKLVGGSIPADEKWNVWDVCGIRGKFSQANVYVEDDEIFIDFKHHQRQIALDGFYDHQTGFFRVAGSDRARNGRIGKEPREGVFLPETGTVVLFKSNNNSRFSQCEILLTLNKKVISAVSDGEIILPQVFKTGLGKTKNEIYKACDNGTTARWIKRYWDINTGYRPSKSVDVFSPSEFRSIFNTPFSEDALEYLTDSITDNDLCGLEKMYSRAEVIKNQRNTRKLLSVSKRGLTTQLVKNLINTHHDLWLLRMKEHLLSQSSLLPTEKLEKVKEALLVSERLKNYSTSYFEELAQTIASKKDEYAAEIIDNKLNNYESRGSLTIDELDEIANLRKMESDLFGYLKPASFGVVKDKITRIINVNAEKALKTYIDARAADKDIESLVTISAKFRNLFQFLGAPVKQIALSRRADHVFYYISDELSMVYRRGKLTLTDINVIANYQTDHPSRWNILSNEHREKLDIDRKKVVSDNAPRLLLEKLKAAEVEKIYVFYDFYHSEAESILALMQPKDKQHLHTQFYIQLGKHCSFDMALTASSLLDTREMQDYADSLNVIQYKVKASQKDDEALFCYARFLVNNDRSIVQQQSQFIDEARKRFDNSRKYCSVITDGNIKFLAENQRNLPFMEERLRLLEDKASGAQKILNGMSLGLSNAQCESSYPYLNFKY